MRKTIQKQINEIENELDSFIKIAKPVVKGLKYYGYINKEVEREILCCLEKKPFVALFDKMKSDNINIGDFKQRLKKNEHNDGIF